jgi:hypothetical protein
MESWTGTWNRGPSSGMMGRGEEKAMPRTVSRPRSRPARRLRASAAAALIASCLALVGFAPPVGSDVMVTDAGGGRFVGVGHVDDDGLALELAERVGELRLLLVRPDGTSQVWRGRVLDGRLILLDDEGAEIDVADALAREDRKLRLAWPGNATVVPAHDARDASGEDESGGDDEASDDRNRRGGGPPVSVPPVDEAPLPDTPVGPPPELPVDPPGLDDATP